MATGDIGALYTKGINKNFLLKLDEYPPTWRRIVHFSTMDTPYIDQQGWGGYPNPQMHLPGEPVTMGSFFQNFSKRYLPTTYAMGDTIPLENMRDDLYGIIHEMTAEKGGGMADAFTTYTEILVAGLFMNYGFASGAIPYGADGVSLYSTSHPLSAAQPDILVSNRPSVDVDLSISSYNEAYTNISLQKAPNNIKIIANKPRVLVFHPSLRTVAKQILQDGMEAGTADHNKNVVDKIELVSWPYFTLGGASQNVASQYYNAWMVLGDTHYVNFMMRENIKFRTQEDITTLSQIVVAYMSFAMGWSDWRGTYGSLGN